MDTTLSVTRLLVVLNNLAARARALAMGPVPKDPGGPLEDWLRDTKSRVAECAAECEEAMNLVRRFATVTNNPTFAVSLHGDLDHFKSALERFGKLREAEPRCGERRLLASECCLANTRLLRAWRALNVRVAAPMRGPELCAEWEHLAGEIHAKAPDSAEAQRLIVLSDLIRDRIRVLCLPVDAAAMEALAAMRGALAHLPTEDPRVCGPEVTTPLANAYVAVRALWEHEAEREKADKAGGEGGSARDRAGNDQPGGVALTANQADVLQTMARFDASRLLSAKVIAAEMNPHERLSEETVRQCIGKLIEAELAERPEGHRSGARLNRNGRKLAGQNAD